MPDIVISGLSRVFPDGTCAVDNVDIHIADGEFFTLLGPSGCGKSTTLACIAGLDTPSHGRISIGARTIFDKEAGIAVPCEERNVGMMFQSYALWPHMTVAQNLALPLSIRKVPHDARKRMIGDALEVVDLSAFGHRYPHELSGGQQQRVALARALVYSPTVLLLDEPLSNLDARLRHQARTWVKRVQKELGITTVYVTHDQEEALAMSDNVAVMSAGRVRQIADPRRVYETPSTMDVAAFVGRMNFLHGTVSSVDGEKASVQIEGTNEELLVPNMASSAAGIEVVLAFRPEKAVVKQSGNRTRPLNALTAELVEQAYVGFRYEYKFRCGNSVIEAYGAAPSAYGRCFLEISPDSLIAYDAAGLRSPGPAQAARALNARASHADIDTLVPGK
ncbi:ABC transporter ATP-binding protein [Microvirga sp. M2]|uniref:ABC transporter ATP-binding protein n=1 Tax=Microvirga sp. M2 TaxID=3073270 RepID=UPI0039C2E861